ncbi:MAG: hypothetical protein JF628_05255 [Sphingomonas sp.]|nr:hypothetical protein [Sphingomonas sp.]
MKLSGIALAAAVAVSAIAAAPVSAQDRVSQRQVEVHRTVTTTARSGPHWRHHMGRRKICRTHWYHHRKVTRCTWRRWG